MHPLPIDHTRRTPLVKVYSIDLYEALLD
jgi:hypothetical protein